MKIFLSYSSKDRLKAEEIALALQAQGNDVFFDKDDLSGGEDFHSVIREHVANADLFVFLISPESVRPGAYTLTELRLIREKWASPKKHVLPVMLEPTNMETIPPYLKGVTLFEPEGSVAAEVAAHIGRSSHRLATILIVGAMAAVAIAELIYFCCKASGASLGPDQQRQIQLLYQSPSGWEGKTLRAHMIYFKILGLLPLLRGTWEFRPLAATAG